MTPGQGDASRLSLPGASVSALATDTEGSDVLFSVLHDDLPVRADEARGLQDEWVRSLVGQDTGPSR